MISKYQSKTTNYKWLVKHNRFEDNNSSKTPQEGYPQLRYKSNFRCRMVSFWPVRYWCFFITSSRGEREPGPRKNLTELSDCYIQNEKQGLFCGGRGSLISLIIRHPKMCVLSPCSGLSHMEGLCILLGWCHCKKHHPLNRLFKSNHVIFHLPKNSEHQCH